MLSSGNLTQGGGKIPFQRKRHVSISTVVNEGEKIESFCVCGVQQQQQVAARTSVEASASGFPFTLINTCHIAFRIQRDGVEGGRGGNNIVSHE